MRSHEDRWKLARLPRWKQYRASGNPPSKYRRRWRKQARTIATRALKLCRDFETLQMFRADRITSIYDWY